MNRKRRIPKFTIEDLDSAEQSATADLDAGSINRRESDRIKQIERAKHIENPYQSSRIDRVAEYGDLVTELQSAPSLVWEKI
jgi:hypothetical protein